MASYIHIVPHVIKWEGGLVYHPNEKQWTNKGVQWNTYTRHSLRLLGQTPSMERFKELTDYQLGKFIELYWNTATNNNRIKDQDSANQLFNAYWASGAEGLKDMQRALNKAYGEDLTIDGKIGPATTHVVNANRNAAIVLYNAMADRFRRLGKNPKFAKFEKGWLNRLRTLKPVEKGSIAIFLAAIIMIVIILK